MSRQRELARGEVGEAYETPRSGEPTSVIKDTAHPPWKELMEEVAAHANLVQAMRRVRKNRGSPGSDRMTVATRASSVSDCPRGRLARPTLAAITPRMSPSRPR